MRGFLRGKIFREKNSIRDFSTNDEFVLDDNEKTLPEVS
jgi:hypothetical protein